MKRMNCYTPNKHQQNIESHQLATKTCQLEFMNHEGRGEIDMVISFRCFLWNCPMDLSVICQSMPCIPRALMSWFAFRLHCRNALRAEKRKSPSLIRKTPSTCFIAYPITIMLERWLMGMLTSNLIILPSVTTLSLSLSHSLHLSQNHVTYSLNMCKPNL